MPSQRLPTWSRVPTPMAPVQPEVLVLPEMLARPEVPVRLEALMPPWRPSRHAAAWWWQRPPAASRSLKIESSRAMCGVGAPAKAHEARAAHFVQRELARPPRTRPVRSA